MYSQQNCRRTFFESSHILGYVMGDVIKIGCIESSIRSFAKEENITELMWAQMSTHTKENLCYLCSTHTKPFSCLFEIISHISVYFEWSHKNYKLVNFIQRQHNKMLSMLSSSIIKRCCSSRWHPKGLTTSVSMHILSHSTCDEHLL